MKVSPLQPYGTRSGNTGVHSFAVLPGALLVQFRSGEGYLYDGERPGSSHVIRMTRLALRGAGLSTYISRNVQHDYRLKLSQEELEQIVREITSSLALEA